MTDTDDAAGIRLALGGLVLAANQLEYEIARVACGRGSDPAVWACIENALLHPGDARKACRGRVETAPPDLMATVTAALAKADELAEERNRRVHGFLMPVIREDTGAVEPPVFFHPKSGTYTPADAAIINELTRRTTDLIAEMKALSVAVHQALATPPAPAKP